MPKKIKCINTGKTYSSAKKASKDIGVSEINILQICNRMRDHIRGFRFEYTGEENEKICSNNKSGNICR